MVRVRSTRRDVALTERRQIATLLCEEKPVASSGLQVS
jgi:hypothetical protein